MKKRRAPGKNKPSRKPRIKQTDRSLSRVPNPHAERLMRKACEIRDHIYKVKHDLQSRIRLSQLEDKIARLKERYNGKDRKKRIGKLR